MKSLVWIVVLFFSLKSSSFFGGEASGGGESDLHIASSIKQLLSGSELKSAMINYLRMVNPDSIKNKVVKKYLGNRKELEKDILTRNNYVFATEKQKCTNVFGEVKEAATVFGDVGGIICFDIDLLVEKMRDLNDELRMIRLAALAFHEHVHHFQIYKPGRYDFLEKEAEEVGGYVELTAKYSLIPTLRWVPEGRDEELNSILELNQLLRHKERMFLEPPVALKLKYPEFLNKEDRGLIRLLPSEKYHGTFYNQWEWILLLVFFPRA